VPFLTVKVVIGAYRRCVEDKDREEESKNGGEATMERSNLMEGIADDH
jgi:hypothetical protein